MGTISNWLCVFFQENGMRYSFDEGVWLHSLFCKVDCEQRRGVHAHFPFPVHGKVINEGKEKKIHDRTRNTSNYF